MEIFHMWDIVSLLGLPMPPGRSSYYIQCPCCDENPFDMDFATNHHVQNGYNSLLQLLGNMGFTFGTYLWDPRYKGLDDYVLACFAGMQSQ